MRVMWSLGMILVNVLHPFAPKFKLQLCSRVNVELVLEPGWHWLSCRRLLLHEFHQSTPAWWKRNTETSFMV